MALAESTIRLSKAECAHFQRPWHTVDELELATLIWVDGHNTIRLHSSIRDIPNAEYEHNDHEREINTE